jgi:hypothetical protein
VRQFRNEIEKIAYELYEKSGKVHGHDFEHWFEAERIVAAWQEHEKAEKQQNMEMVEKRRTSGNRKPASPVRAGKPRAKK